MSNGFMGVALDILSFISIKFILLWSIVVTVFALFYHASKDPLSKVPGPFISKWTGIVNTFYYVRGYRHEYVHSLHRKYGTALRVHLAFRMFYLTSCVVTRSHHSVCPWTS